MIKYPSSKAKVEKATREFLQKFGFPRILGCVDGTYIPISEPYENHYDYFSYKIKYTIKVQAICDCNRRFTDVDIKWLDSLHDARVFANFKVQKVKLKENLSFVMRNSYRAMSSYLRYC